MSKKVPITVAHGNGIGPEIMKAVLFILEEAGAQLDIETVEIGEAIYLKGNPAGIEESAWESLRRTKVFFKAPITTPQGGGVKSLNVTVRKALGLYANVRPCVSYAPFIQTKHPNMDVVVVRENEEDLYAGIEHRQTTDVMQCLKLITRPGCERIARYAFEYAIANDRKKVTCFTKDNIMKMTDGLFHEVFEEIAKEYPSIEPEHWIVDIGAAKLADTPEAFDVVVLPNLYGDILSDVAAQISGSVGLAGSANIGADYAMFEAIHGSAPRRAGQDLANPSGLFFGAMMMLVHIGQASVARRAHNAWLKTIEEGIHTYDIFEEGLSTQKVGTQDFAKAVAQRMGQTPEKLPAAHYSETEEAAKHPPAYKRPKVERKCVGVDMFVHCTTSTPEQLGKQLQTCESDGLSLTMIATRGMSVWPQCAEVTLCTDHFQCRFQLPEDSKDEIGPEVIIALLNKLHQAGVEIVKTENLYTFNGEEGFTRGQGQ